MRLVHNTTNSTRSHSHPLIPITLAYLNILLFLGEEHPHLSAVEVDGDREPTELYGAKQSSQNNNLCNRVFMQVLESSRRCNSLVVAFKITLCALGDGYAMTVCTP